MTSDRTKLLRGVLVFLAGCAVLGFVMGLRGALPAGDIGYGDEASPVNSGVVVDASPVQDIPQPTLQEEEPQAKEEAAEAPETTEPEPAAEEPEPKPEPKPAPKPAPPPKPAPKEEAPPADPVGDLIQGPSVLNNLY